MRIGAALLSLVILSGCSQVMGACNADLQAHVTPSTTTLSVGQRVTAQAEFRGCSGRERLADRVTWTSDAPAVARVGPTTGEITAVAPGRAEVVPTGARYGRAPAVQVEVR